MWGLSLRLLLFGGNRWTGTVSGGNIFRFNEHGSWKFLHPMHGRNGVYGGGAHQTQLALLSGVGFVDFNVKALILTSKYVFF